MTEKETPKTEYMGAHIPSEIKEPFQIYLIKTRQTYRDWLIKKIEEEIQTMERSLK